MKKLLTLTVMALVIASCGSPVEDQPVESDEVIGDGVVPLPEPVSEPEPVLTVEREEVSVSVGVVGDSLAGWAAAIAAAREGASVALIGIDDTPDTIGGQAAEANVTSWDGYVTSGFDLELRERVGALYREADASLDDCYSSYWSTRNADGWRPELIGFDEESHAAGRFCPHRDVLQGVLWEMLDEAGVLYVPAVGAVWEGETVANDEYVVTAEVWVEATETGEMIPESLRRAIPDECQQDTTHVLVLSEPSLDDTRPTVADFANGVVADAEWFAFWQGTWETGVAVSPYGKEWKPWYTVGGPGVYPTLFDNMALYRRTTDLDGRVHLPINWGNDGRTAEDSVYAGEQLIAFLATTEMSDWNVEFTSENYQRTSLYRLNGTTHMAEAPRGEPINAGASKGADSWTDSIGIGGTYRADFHGQEGQCEGVEGAEPYGAYDVPAGVFLPAERANLLVGMPRSGDVSHLVATSIRMQPPELDLGWSVGVWAAMAAEADLLPHDIDVDVLRQRILDSDTVNPQVDVILG